MRGQSGRPRPSSWSRGTLLKVLLALCVLFITLTAVEWREVSSAPPHYTDVVVEPEEEEAQEPVQQKGKEATVESSTSTDLSSAFSPTHAATATVLTHTDDDTAEDITLKDFTVLDKPCGDDIAST